MTKQPKYYETIEEYCHFRITNHIPFLNELWERSKAGEEFSRSQVLALAQNHGINRDVFKEFHNSHSMVCGWNIVETPVAVDSVRIEPMYQLVTIGWDGVNYPLNSIKSGTQQKLAQGITRETAVKKSPASDPARKPANYVDPVDADPKGFVGYDFVRNENDLPSALFMKLHNYAQGGAARYYKETIALTDTLQTNSYKLDLYRVKPKDIDHLVEQYKGIPLFFIDLLVPSAYGTWDSPADKPAVIDFIERLLEASPNSKLCVAIGGTEPEFVTYWSRYLTSLVDIFFAPRESQFKSLYYYQDKGEVKMKEGHRCVVVPFVIEDQILESFNAGESAQHSFIQNEWVFNPRMMSTKRPIILHEIAKSAKNLFPDENFKVKYIGAWFGMPSKSIHDTVVEEANYEYEFIKGYTTAEAIGMLKNAKYTFDLQNLMRKDGSSFTEGVQYCQIDSIMAGVLPVVADGSSPGANSFYTIPKEWNVFPFRRANFDFSQVATDLMTMSFDDYYARLYYSMEYFKQLYSKSTVANQWNQLLASLI